MNNRKSILITLLAILLIFNSLAIARAKVIDKARGNTPEYISPSYIYSNHIPTNDVQSSKIQASDVYSSDIHSSDNIWVS